MFRFSNFLRDLTTIRKALILSAVLFAGGIAIGWGSEEFEQLLLSQLQGRAGGDESGAAEVGQPGMELLCVYIFEQ